MEDKRSGCVYVDEGGLKRGEEGEAGLLRVEARRSRKLSGSLFCFFVFLFFFLGMATAIRTWSLLASTAERLPDTDRRCGAPAPNC